MASSPPLVKIGTFIACGKWAAKVVEVIHDPCIISEMYQVEIVSTIPLPNKYHFKLKSLGHIELCKWIDGAIIGGKYSFRLLREEFGLLPKDALVIFRDAPTP